MRQEASGEALLSIFNDGKSISLAIDEIKPEAQAELDDLFGRMQALRERELGE